MLIESTVIPLPSEIVMIPAGYLVYQNKMNFCVVILMGVLGSLLGSVITFLLSLTLGRRFLFRYGKYFFLKSEKLLLMEKIFQRYGTHSIFYSRLLPVARHLISIPAGIGRMNFVRFCLTTAIGSLIWVFILTCIGYLCGDGNSEVFKIVNIVIISIVVISVGFSFVWINRKSASL